MNPNRLVGAWTLSDEPGEPRIDVRSLAATLCDLGDVDQLKDLGTRSPLVASAGARSLFHCLFGRDAIRMAMDLVDDFPALARTTVLELARLQGVRENPRGEEEPGRILHENRPDADPHTAGLGALWDFPYYGSVDSTPQWINLLARVCMRDDGNLLATALTDRLGRTRTVRDVLADAVAWMLRGLDARVAGGFSG